MKIRKIQTKIWRDEWFSSLTQEAKLVFLYLITNGYMGLSGFCEISDKQIIFDTGINQKKLDVIKIELTPKVIFFAGWVYVKNLLKHDPIEGEHNTLWTPYKKELISIPEHIKAILDGGSMPHPSPIDGGKGIGIGKGMRGGVGGNNVDNSPLHDEFRLFIQYFNEQSNKKYETTDARYEKFAVRRKKYSMDDLKSATRALLKSPFHTGKDPKGNPSNTWYATPDLLLRNDETVDKWKNAQAQVKHVQAPAWHDMIPCS